MNVCNGLNILRSSTDDTLCNDSLLERYTHSNNRLFLLDYDGTLMPFMDDSESVHIVPSLMDLATKDSDIHILDLPPFSDLEINAIQRGSTIILQKSLKEGFALTVSEVFWKENPVIASVVEGIPSQI